MAGRSHLRPAQLTLAIGLSRACDQLGPPPVDLADLCCRPSRLWGSAELELAAISGCVKHRRDRSWQLAQQSGSEFGYVRVTSVRTREAQVTSATASVPSFKSRDRRDRDD
jgi:hypothetical protein